MSTIVTRTAKGSALTFAEGDNNFTNLNTDKAELTDLASNTKGEGASLVGIEDADDWFASTTVEGALAELASSPAGVNHETLAAAKTLVADDEVYQLLNPNAQTRIITLDNSVSMTTDKIFSVYNTDVDGNSGQLTILDGVAGSTIYTLQQGGSATFTYDGSTWHNITSIDFNGVVIGDDAYIEDSSVAIGGVATSVSNSTAVGEIAEAEIFSVSVGDSAFSTDHAVSVGSSASAATGGVSVGDSANSDFGGVALGENTNCINSTGVAIGSGADAGSFTGAQALGANAASKRDYETSYSPYGTGKTVSGLGWTVQTFSTSPTEMTLGVSANRAVLGADSIIAFELLVVGRDRTTRNCAAFQFKGAIKRDNASNTALIGVPSKDILGKDVAGFDCTVTADNTNESLKITVTSPASNLTDWLARGHMTEIDV